MRSDGRHSRRAALRGTRAGQSRPTRRRRRDRRGRGLRGPLAPREVPLNRTRSESFDDVVLAAVDELEQHWAAEMAALEFAVVEVPDSDDDALAAAPEAVLDRGVMLGRLQRDGLHQGEVHTTDPVIVVYRRPIEARSLDREDCADLVFMVVVDLVAEYLGRDIDELDPP